MSSPELSPKASSASHVGTFPGLSGVPYPLLVAVRGRHQAHFRSRRRAGVLPKTSLQQTTVIVAETSAAELADDMLDRLAAMPVGAVAHVNVEGRRGEVMASFDEKEKRESNA